MSSSVGLQGSFGTFSFDMTAFSRQPAFDPRAGDLRHRECGPHACDRHHDDCGRDPGAGGDPLQVNGNSVNTGRYTITASNDDGGTLKVTDNANGESYKVWGDPHVTTDKGDTTTFQHAPATFDLPDGTKITVNPANNTFINDVTVTKGNDAVKMTGFQGNLQTQALPGEGHYLDRTTPDGTVLTAHDGNIDQLQVRGGPQISGNNVPNIDGYANNSGGQLHQEIAQLEQEIASLFGDLQRLA